VLLCALALILVVAPLVSALLSKRAKTTPGAKHARYARSLLILWAMTWLALYALRLHGEGPEDVGWIPPNVPIYPYVLVLVFVGMLGAAGALSRRPTNPDYAERIRRIAPFTTADWLWYVPLALSAGICEEFLYRGYALHIVAALTHSVALGVVLSTAAFGLAHAYQGWRGVVGTTLFGLFFALIVVFFGSLWPCMLGHALQDLIGGFIVSRRLAAEPAPSSQEPRLSG
jgi:membrane protease YdiL (CAAX protease family)